MSGPSDLAQRVPAVAWPIPEISHLSIKEQKQVILFNARVSTIFPVPGKFSDFEYQELEIFLDQILLDSDKAFAQDNGGAAREEGLHAAGPHGDREPRWLAC